ncbi:CASP-like protein, putative isoform 1 [Capsicum annuum]|nr:CASP-like protein, putative isoform 1 [Capsicum annuum]
MAAATAPTSFHIRRSFNYNANLQNSFPKVRSVKAPSIITANSLRAPRPQNVSGEFFVDHTCIDCDTCRWMAPENFTRAGDMSAVFKQPSCEEERLRALQALLSCPTRSIHTEKPPHDILEVQKTFPIPIDEHTLTGVYHCGYHSDKSFGAASYLIVRAEGNILVDSPRYTTKLENNLKMLGGARYMFLTHSDDIADHEKWSNHLGCERILHSLEVDHSTAAVEIKLEGSGPWSLSDDVTLVHTPGHTEGSVCLLYKPRNVLFTGDHFAMGERGWTIFERYNKLSVPKQLNSVKLMLDLDFEWILPGHGRRAKFRDVEEKNSSLRAFLETKMQLL